MPLLRPGLSYVDTISRLTGYIAFVKVLSAILHYRKTTKNFSKVKKEYTSQL